VYAELYVPYFGEVTDLIHSIAPGVKTFLHSCGAIYDLIPHIIEAGIDILNPVQWSAGMQGFKEWKDAARGKIALWGGGVNTQSTFPLGTVADIEAEVREVSAYMAEDNGYVFCPIHNILAEITPDRIIAAYRSAVSG
jgi:uroporphyrinogen decarboxylase